MGDMTSEPLFPLPAAAHWTYVRVEGFPPDLPALTYVGLCRACDWRSPYARAFYSGAFKDCIDHHRQVADEAGSAEDLGLFPVRSRGRLAGPFPVTSHDVI
jgi:hypothetical protein